MGGFIKEKFSLVSVMIITTLFLLLQARDVRAQDQKQSLIRLTNKCSFSIWPTWITTSSKGPQISSGTELDTGSSYFLYAPWEWRGKFWSRTNCSWQSTGGTSRFVCATGGCGDYACSKDGSPPFTAAEYKPLGDPKTSLDYYQVSVSKGFNLAIQISPSDKSCPSATVKNKALLSCHSGSDYTITFCP